MWAGLSRPNAAFYVPFYFGINGVPPRYSCGADSCLSAFAVFEKLSGIVLSDHSRHARTVSQAQERFESRAIELQKTIDRTAAGLYEKNPGLARDFLAIWVSGLCAESLAIAEGLTKELEPESGTVSE
jgi:dipeptidase